MLRDQGISQQDARGKWVPAIPRPFYEKRFLRRERFVCTCGEVFESEHRYDEHWRVKHGR